jgi:hypothetical protein
MAATTSGLNRFSLFSDEVFSSTDLNRRAGEVLDHASKGPVTISRNKEMFALLPRDSVAELVKAVGQFGATLDLLEAALNAVEGKEPTSPFTWLKAFGTNDLRKMIREVLVASSSALRETGDWEIVAAIVHEWHESALVAASGVLEKAMESPADESPLPDPRELIEAPIESATTTAARD